ncbi:MAG TPA: class I SAM-dependent methyltransferase [Legionella sp.]|nr:class I SAM-dependent methyltransferase [Legionella sp.]
MINNIEKLDKWHNQFLNNEPVKDIMDDIVSQLNNLRRSCTSAIWKDFTQLCQAHPVANILQQDPFTDRAYKKPRGYAGDAVMMDYLYASDGAIEKDFDFKLTKMGQDIFKYSLSRSSSKSVCIRLQIIIELLNQVVESKENTRLLAVASGHLREALHIDDPQAKLQEFIAFDQDPQSLAVVAEDIKHIKTKTIQGSIGDILKKRITLQDFDFIYATGLYDYLDDATATLLTQYLFLALKPGGRLLIPNFTPDMQEIGYMEAFMNWWLIYRDAQGIEQFIHTIPQEEIEKINIFTDGYKNIVFLEVYKK